MECSMKTKGIIATIVLVLPFPSVSSICDADGFDSVHCGIITADGGL
jgi:hypothetical protein